MSTKNKKSTLTQALLEMEEITSAIKEESKKSLNALLSEAVRDAIREGCNEEDEEDDYEVVDDEKNDAIDTENETDATDSVEDAEKVEDGEDVQDVNTSGDVDAAQDAPEDGEGEEDWNEFGKYQVGDDTYDLTGENDYESVVKVYKLLKDEDHVIVKKDGDKIQLKDDSVGTEYVIDLGADEDGDSVEVESGEENFDSLNEEHWENGQLVGITRNDEFDPISQLRKRGYLGDESSDIAGFSDGEDDMDFSEDETDDLDPSVAPTEHEPSAREIADVEQWMDGLDDDDEYDFDDSIYESRKINNKKQRSNFCR